MNEPSSASTAASRPAPARPYTGFLKSNLREYGMLISLVAIMAFFQVVTDGTLLEPLNLTNLVLQNSYIVIMALGMLLVIVAGHIDLSVGSVVGFIGALAAVLMVEYGWHLVPATAACLLAGAAIGAAQGWFVAFFRIPSFIVTLAGMLVFKGLSWRCCRASRWGLFRAASAAELRLSSRLFNGETLRTPRWRSGWPGAAAMGGGGVAPARTHQRAHGIDNEPTPFFFAKLALFAA
jgi:putative multiple sugar transport system permease protein